MNNALTEQLSASRFRVAAAIAGINALVSTGFAIAALVTGPSTIAWYAADRAAALAVAVLVVAALGSRAGLLAVGWTLTAVQAADAFVGLGTAEVTKVVGPAGLAIATGAALVALGRQHVRSGATT